MTPIFRVRNLSVCAALIALVWLVFGQTVGHDFVNLDDNTYVYGNSLTRGGLSWQGVGRAFVDTRTDNWHPLTLISHMTDCELFGLKPGPHHFTNVLLHSIAVLLLFLFLRNATARFWSSAFVAALFAIHPLRVESVAWIAERKDVLSAVFFFITLIAYAHYVATPSLRNYLTMAIAFALGLMSKPMLVTTPIVLLVLDYWPLRRWQGARSWEQRFRSTSQPLNTSTYLGGLVVEKLPLFAMSAASSIVAIVLQIHSPIGQLPFLWQLENALVTCASYIWQIFWPVNLAVFYPHPNDTLAIWQIALASVVLIGITLSAFAVRKTRPYLLVGWLWYLIMLLPVIGIIQVGLQGHADRYTYLPHVGLYVALTWLIVDLSKPLLYRDKILSAAAAVAVIALGLVAWKQTTYWRNSETLWTHALAVTKDNEFAYTNLGMLASERGQFDQALSLLQTALDIRSRNHDRYYDLRRAIILDDIGEVLVSKGQPADAIFYFRQSLELKPDYPFSRYNLGAALFHKGDVDEAIAEWQKVLAIQPNDPGTLTNIANAFALKGRLRDAIAHYEMALQSDPENARALNNLAWMLATAPDDSIRDGKKAVELGERANRASDNGNPLSIRTLAAAYAAAGQFEKATDVASRASQLAESQRDQDLAAQIGEETKLYRQHQPLRDQSLANRQ